MAEPDVTDLPPKPPAPARQPAGLPGGDVAHVPLIDWPAFEEEYDGAQSVVEKLVQTVTSTRSEDPERLRIAAEAGDAGTIRFLAHGLKTIGALIKCPALRDAARSAESAAAAGRSDAPALALELAGTLDRMLGELRARLAADSPG